MTNPNVEDIERFYDLLGHETETEIRIFKGPDRNFFVRNKKDFVDKVVELNNAGFDVYAGINERRLGGTKEIDVKYWGIMFIDFDVHSNKERIEDVKKEVLQLANEFNQNEVTCSTDFSGRGYHLLIPFKRIELTEQNIDEIKKRIRKFKQMLVERYKVDSSTFDLARVCRVTGTINYNNNMLSEFIEYKPRVDNEILFKFIDELPDKEDRKQSADLSIESLEKQRFCRFFEEVALQEKFPQGQRHLTLAKNFSIYDFFGDRGDLKKKFMEKQGMTEEDFIGWERKVKSGELKEFNCGEIINYIKEHDLPNVCTFCPYNNFRYNDRFISVTNDSEKASFVIEKLFYSYKKANVSSLKNINYNYPYSIFQINVAAGNEPRFLIVKNISDVREGDSTHYIKPLREDKDMFNTFIKYAPEDKKIKEMLKLCGMGPRELEKEKNVFKRIMDEDGSRPDGLFMVLSPGIEKENILCLSNEDLKKLVENFITLGLDIDENIKISFMSDFFIPSIEKTDFNTYQYYNNHKFIFTNTKAGKTTISSRIGHNATRSTVKNLLGFSTSDEISRGTLHGNIIPYYVDELQEDESKSMYGKLLNFMELGKVNIDVGKKSIECKGLSSLTFLGNPKGEINNQETEFLIAGQFNNTLNLITNNYVALGSRMGFVLFDPKTKYVSGNSKFQGRDYDLLTAKIELLRNLTSEKFSLIMKKEYIMNFLNKKYDEKYEKNISEIISHCGVDSIKQFLRGHLESYKHANGMALRLALLDHLNDLINDMINQDALIKSCNHYLEFVKGINIDSFRILAEGEKIKSFFISYYREEFDKDSIPNKVLLEAIYKIFSLDKKNSQVRMNSLLDAMRESKYKTDAYTNSSIIERFSKQKLSNMYKIDYTDYGGLQFFIVRDPIILEYIFESQASDQDPQRKII